MNSPILSLVIPIFNAENFLAILLDSILLESKNQENIEILLLNDGSTDQSAFIMANYASRYSFIKVFQSPNEGVYKTRNFALAHAKGDYIWFLDADDKLLPKAVENIISCIHSLDHVDIITFGYQVEEASGKVIERKPPTENIVTTGLHYLSDNDGRLYLWNNVYKSSFLKQNNLKFLAKSYSLEDSLFNMQTFALAKKVYCFNKVLYFYRYNFNSISKKKSLANRLKQGESSMNVHLEALDFCNCFPKDSDAYQILKYKLAHSVLGFFFSLLKENYPISYIQKVFKIYKSQRLLPVKRKKNTLKISLFQWCVNAKYPFFFLVRFFRTFNLFVR